MKRLILSTLTLIFAAAAFFPIAAQKQQAVREVKIYLYGAEVSDRTGIPDRYLIEVKRNVEARAPLKGALEALLAGATEEEEKNKMHSFIYGVELQSVRIKNKTVRVDFKFDKNENSWLAPAIEELFEDAVKRTAKQFATVERVLVCVDGIENFFLSKEFHKKCPEDWAGGEK